MQREGISRGLSFAAKAISRRKSGAAKGAPRRGNSAFFGGAPLSSGHRAGAEKPRPVRTGRNGGESARSSSLRVCPRGFRAPSRRRLDPPPRVAGCKGRSCAVRTACPVAASARVRDRGTKPVPSRLAARGPAKQTVGLCGGGDGRRRLSPYRKPASSRQFHDAPSLRAAAAFNWPEFNSELLADARRLLNGALNKGSKPTNIVSDIVVKELNMGSPPELEILEISELTEEKFRGIFKFTYLGDAFVVLETKVQVRQSLSWPILGNPRQDVLAAEPLVLPMRLRISSLCLNGIVVLVVDQHRGVTLAFKNDPVERVDVSSTFDGMPNVQRFLQAEIEKQLRSLFQDDLPAMVHTLSLRYLQEAWQRRGAEALRGDGPDATYEDSVANLSDRSESVSCGSVFGYEQPGTPSAADQLCGGWETFDDDSEGVNGMEAVTDYARLSSLYKGEGLKSLAQEACSDISDSLTLRDDMGPSSPRTRFNAGNVARSDISTSSTLRGLVVHSSGLLATARFVYGLGTVPATGTDSSVFRDLAVSWTGLAAVSERRLLLTRMFSGDWLRVEHVPNLDGPISDPRHSVAATAFNTCRRQLLRWLERTQSKHQGGRQFCS
ncbi:MAG: hypothetical protein BJ554DRAFT_4738 [Olpidium bornovanus]|uniref:SMP-LTD domain-containing protein n=1 Tax=Olpidium bornovanus TaxID=278681 RepID=A0A8H8DEW0_9FUNG|nr:MAG: hypothetical protein BJ554DRAFT_4738 [Olpidium bornovanus]